MFTEILIALRPLGAAMYRKNDTRYSRYSVDQLLVKTPNLFRLTYYVLYFEYLMYLAHMIGHFTDNFVCVCVSP